MIIIEQLPLFFCYWSLEPSILFRLRAHYCLATALVHTKMITNEGENVDVAIHEKILRAEWLAGRDRAHHASRQIPRKRENHKRRVHRLRPRRVRLQ